MTIYEIKERVQETEPYFFTSKTLKFFGQTLKSFSVMKYGEKYLISAPITDNEGANMGLTERLFDPKTNTLERV